MATPLHPLTIWRGIARPHPGDDYCRHDGLPPGARGAARPKPRFPLLKAEAGTAFAHDQKQPRSADLRSPGGE
jgi:hypothetical protein